jgi:predicted DNA binding protein
VTSIVKLQLTIPSSDLSFGDLLERTDSQVEFQQFVPIGERSLPYLLVESGDMAAFERTLEQSQGVESIVRMGDEGTRALYRVEWEQRPNGFFQALAEHDLALERAVGSGDQWSFRLRGPSDALSPFWETLHEQGISNTVERIQDIEQPANNPFGLTDKQREAIELAFEEGYFEVPSETNLTDLAECLEITRQSFRRRLNRGLSNLLRHTVLTDLSDTE